MMDIDFIKWMCDKDEGFDVDSYCHKPCINYPIGDWEFFDNLDHERFELVYYPLLLQRAIEGVNREYEKETNAKAYSIDIMSDCVEIVFDCYLMKNYFIDEFDSIDEAKELALKYIYQKVNK